MSIRGRKPGVGTISARLFVESDKFDAWIDSIDADMEAKSRIKKTIYSGLGIKKRKDKNEDA